MRLDHVQLPMPPGKEDDADLFYRDLLGLTPVAKPENLASRGGRWYGAGPLGVHLGVEEDQRPSKKTHVCFVVDDYEALVQRLEAAGFVTSSDSELAGVVRCYVHDPFGNRIELQRG
jgi:catechol 2,3-dioxygenase-like lactoylglutathione lyase family enzyme